MQNSFLHWKRSQSLRFLRNMQKIEKKNICYHYFLFFVIFSIGFKQNFLKPNEWCLLDRKKPNIAKLAYINFLAFIRSGYAKKGHFPILAVFQNVWDLHKFGLQIWLWKNFGQFFQFHRFSCKKRSFLNISRNLKYMGFT